MHLGVPFHSAQEQPRAPCPLCSAEKGDSAPKKLFFINGIVPGEYDKEIPDTYFQTPPVELVSGEAGSEALRVSESVSESIYLAERMPVSSNILHSFASAPRRMRRCVSLRRSLSIGRIESHI